MLPAPEALYTDFLHNPALWCTTRHASVSEATYQKTSCQKPEAHNTNTAHPFSTLSKLFKDTFYIHNLNIH